MAFTILGPGLVGSLLGAAGGATHVVTGPSGQVRGHRVRLADGLRDWTPQRVATPAAGTPTLVATRTPDTPWSRLGTNCLVAQNGLGQPRPTIACFLAVDQDDDDTVHWTGPRPRIVLEPPHRSWDPVLGAWEDAGIAVERVADAEPARWEKAILNATVGPLCLATGASMATIWSDPALRRLALAATAEGDAIAAAAGVAIAPGLLDRADAFFAQAGGHRPSLLDDPRELPWVLDVLLDAAQAHDVSAVSLLEIARRCRGAVPARA